MSSKKDEIIMNGIELKDLGAKSNGPNVKIEMDFNDRKLRKNLTDDLESQNLQPKPCEKKKICEVMTVAPFLHLENQKKAIETLKTNTIKFSSKFPVKDPTKNVFNNFFGNLNENYIKKSPILSKKRAEFLSVLQKSGHVNHKLENIPTISRNDEIDDNIDDDGAAPIQLSKVMGIDDPDTINNNCDKNPRNFTLSPLTVSAIAYQSILDHLNSLSNSVGGQKNFHNNLTGASITRPITDLIDYRETPQKKQNFLNSTHSSVLENVDIYSASNKIKDNLPDINHYIKSPVRKENGNEEQGHKSQSAPVIVGYSAKKNKRDKKDHDDMGHVNTVEFLQQIARSRIQLDCCLAAGAASELTETNNKTELSHKINVCVINAETRRNTSFQQSNGPEFSRYIEPFNYLMPLQYVNRGNEEPTIANPSCGEDDPVTINNCSAEMEQAAASVQPFNFDDTCRSESTVDSIYNWIIERRHIFMDVGIVFFLFGILFLLFVIVNIIIDSARANNLS